MAVNYAYNYAEIDPSLGNMCIGVYSMTHTADNPNYIEIPVNDSEYLCKYYINGNWYEDAEGTIPWTSSLI